MIYLSPAQMVPDPRYTFVVGKIRVLETQLLNSLQVARLLETKDAEALWVELASCSDYEQHMVQITDPNEYELLLKAELKKVYELAFSLDPDPQALKLLALRHDFHNCKVFSKAQFLGEDPSLALSELGLYPVKEWEQLLAGENQGQLPSDLAQLVGEVQTELEEESDLRMRDMMWDQALYRYLYQQIQSIENPFAKSWLQIRIDCLNLTALMRCKQQKASKRVLEHALLDNGLLARERLISAYEGSLDELASHFISSPYADLIQEGVLAYQRDNSFSHWEKLIDDFEIEFLKQARLVAMGVEPLFAYVLAKENEIKVLQIVLVGKLNNIDKTEIGKRVRKLYA